MLHSIANCIDKSFAQDTIWQHLESSHICYTSVCQCVPQCCWTKSFSYSDPPQPDFFFHRNTLSASHPVLDLSRSQAFTVGGWDGWSRGRSVKGTDKAANSHFHLNVRKWGSFVHSTCVSKLSLSTIVSTVSCLTGDFHSRPNERISSV